MRLRGKKIIEMANNHTKSCSTPYLIKEMQIKTIRYNYTAIRMAVIQNTNTKIQSTNRMCSKRSLIQC